MSSKIKLKLGQICNGVFIPALQKLCGMHSHSGRDTYALVRTLDGLNPELEGYAKAKESLLKKHGGVSNLQALRDKLKSLPMGENQTGSTPERDAVEKEIAKLAPFESLQIPPGAPGYEPFLNELKPVNETEVELFLDHKVPLALDKIDGVFTVFELKELDSTIVEIKA